MRHAFRIGPETFDVFDLLVKHCVLARAATLLTDSVVSLRQAISPEMT